MLFGKNVLLLFVTILGIVGGKTPSSKSGSDGGTCKEQTCKEQTNSGFSHIEVLIGDNWLHGGTWLWLKHFLDNKINPYGSKLRFNTEITAQAPAIQRVDLGGNVEKMLLHSHLVKSVEDLMAFISEEFGEELQEDKEFIEAAEAELAKELELKIIIFTPGDFGLHTDGSEVTEVDSEGQAEIAGVEVGWKIRMIDGELVEDNHKLIKYFLYKAKKSKRNTKIAFAMPEKEKPPEFQEVTFQPGRMGFGTRDSVVINVVPFSQADDLGVSLGWSIFAVDGQQTYGNPKVADKFIQASRRAGGVTQIVFSIPDEDEIEDDEIEEEEIEEEV